MTVHILGAGHFGIRALNMLEKKEKNQSVRVIDKDPAKVEAIRKAGIHAVREEATAYLIQNQSSMPPSDWIIPAVPIHFLLEWLLKAMPIERNPQVVDMPADIFEHVPNPMKGPEKALFTSHATFKCPDDCPEPADRCTYTGQKRPQNLFELLRQLDRYGYPSIVLRSRQMAPGVGGYQVKDLFQVLDQIKEEKGIVLVSTACRCHGVVHALRCL
jgi:hypothetical protein